MAAGDLTEMYKADEIRYNYLMKKNNSRVPLTSLLFKYNLVERLHYEGYSTTLSSKSTTSSCFLSNREKETKMPAPKDPQKREEWLRKQREAHLGKEAWNKNKHLSQEHKDNVSKGLTGKTQSQETIEKRMSKIRGVSQGKRNTPPWNKGKKDVYSQEAKDRMSRSQTGKIQSRETVEKRANSLRGKSQIRKTPPWNKGKTGIYSEETLQKISKSLEDQKQSQETKDKRSSSLKKHYENASNEWKEAKSESAKSAWQNISEEEKQRRLNSFSNPRWQDTEPEKAFEKILINKNIVYKKQKWVGRYKVDFYLPDHNIVVEIFGCFWHQCVQCGFTSGYQNKSFEDIHQYDKEKIRYLQSLGYKTKVIWQHQLK